MINIDKYNQYMSELVYLSAREAAAELGVRPATLYAYVSRGLIRSVPGPGKQRRYDAADIRQLQGQRAEAVPAGSIAGTDKPQSQPLTTSLTLIAEDGPWYRGHSAVELAGSFSLEAVANLLWECETDPFSRPAPHRLPDLPEGLGMMERLMVALAGWPLQDRAAYTHSPALLRDKGAALVRVACAALLGLPEPEALPVHIQLAKAWNVLPGPDAELLRAALVLAADHEFNTSAFAVRCAASTRAPLHAALISGLGAFSGPRHGAHSDRVTAWLERIQGEEDVDRELGAMLQRGEALPGFGHTIYAGRDPRADCLLKLAAAGLGDQAFARLVPKLTDAGEALYGLAPNIDFAFAVIQRQLGLPDEAGKVIFCAGRMVGWVAHALEQYRLPDQIRPRAAYIGERPRRGK